MTSRLVQRIERTGDRQIDQAQRNVHEAVRKINDARIVSGRLAFTTDVDSTTHAFAAATPKRLLHGLSLPTGATPAGWVIVDADAAATFHRTAWDDDSITIQASGNVNAKVWVFA